MNYVGVSNVLLIERKGEDAENENKYARPNHRHKSTD